MDTLGAILAIAITLAIILIITIVKARLKLWIWKRNQEIKTKQCIEKANEFVDKVVAEQSNLNTR